MAESVTERARMWGQIYMELCKKGLSESAALTITVELMRNG